MSTIICFQAPSVNDDRFYIKHECYLPNVGRFSFENLSKIHNKLNKLPDDVFRKREELEEVLKCDLA